MKKTACKKLKKKTALKITQMKLTQCDFGEKFWSIRVYKLPTSHLYVNCFFPK